MRLHLAKVALKKDQRKQPWVQGAYGLGHVAVVEQVLNNGDVIASNMNWGAYYWQVTNVKYTPGPGVTFITV